LLAVNAVAALSVLDSEEADNESVPLLPRRGARRKTAGHQLETCLISPSPLFPALESVLQRAGTSFLAARNSAWFGTVPPSRADCATAGAVLISGGAFVLSGHTYCFRAVLMGKQHANLNRECLDALVRSAVTSAGVPLEIIDAERADAGVCDSGRWTTVCELAVDGQRYRLVREDTRALTPRERDVVEHVLRGSSNKVIAYDLGIAHATVRVLVSRAMHKLGVRDRAELVARAAALVRAHSPVPMPSAVHVHA
jgi:DNA-binding CsgD family transcriptional regulator